jgi:SecD/SecF fusion protein
MFKRNLWKIVLSALIMAFAVAELLPLQDQPFADYVRAHVTSNSIDFDKLLDDAATRVNSHQAPSVFVALKQIATERKVDLTQYFPDINIESTLKNVQKRNDILLNELLRRSKSKFQLGLDLKGGIAVTLEVDTKAAGRDGAVVRQDQLTKAIEIISNRINAFGVAEPVIRAVGDNRIEIELPGVNTKDNPEILDNIKKPAQLSFHLVHPTLTPGPGVETPPGYELMSHDEDTRTGQTYTQEVFVKRIPEMTGKAISDAYVLRDSYGNPIVGLRLTDEGRKKFYEVTHELVLEARQTGRIGHLAIVLDGKLYSAPQVDPAQVGEGIDSNTAQISGSFTDREALDLSNVLKNPLDVPLVVKEQYEVGPSLAQDAISSGVRASVIGVALVAGFMITFYTVGGLVAVLMLAVNLVIILGVMASFGATMTLPGLAGIVLTVGMAVDANILIFERMREELALGKSLATANESGYLKALWTILDAHAVQLIICCIMIWLGKGPIRGFGVTLAIGVLSTLFSVLITAHLLMEWIIESGLVKKIQMNRLLKDIQVDFVRYGKPAFIGSWLVVIIGFSYVLYQGHQIYGIDFSGGDMVNVEYAQQPDAAKVREVAKAAGVSDINVTAVTAIGGGKPALNIETPEGKGDVVFDAMQNAFPQAGLNKIGQSHIGSSIGEEIELNALLAVGVSMATILLYIAFRFEFGFGVGAMFSSLHDILMTIGIFVLTGHKFSAPMVAAILCIAGYSINETVVVFDRIREELKLNPNGSLRDIVNAAIRKVFARTIMTASTTFLAALALFLFGGGVLRDISFTFLVGIVTSTFSAIFIASQVFYWWHKGDRKHVEAHSDIAPKYEWQGASRASR